MNLDRKDGTHGDGYDLFLNKNVVIQMLKLIETGYSTISLAERDEH